MNMNERVKVIRNHLKLNQLDFGGKIGLTKSSISNIEKGVRNVTDQHVILISGAFSVNENWLRTGEGEMFVESDSTIIAELAGEYNLDEVDQKIIEHYVGLDERDRQTIKEYVVSLAEQITSVRESAATIDENKDIEEELERTRLELEAEKKGRISLASDDTRDKNKGAG